MAARSPRSWPRNSSRSCRRRSRSKWRGVMTQSGGGSDGYAPRLYEAEVYAKVAGVEANTSVWDPNWRDPSEIAGKYSNKAAEVYQRIVAAEGGSYRAGLEPSDVDYRGMPHDKLISMVHDSVSPEDIDEQGMIVNDLGNAQKQLASDFRQALTKEEANWRGAGADAAHTFVKQLADWADSSGDAAFLPANRYS